MSRLRALAAAAALLVSAPPAEAMTYQYSVDQGRLIIQAAGDFETDEGKRFLAFIDGLPAHLFTLFDGKATMVFDSSGGSLAAGFVIAHIVWNFHLTTSVAKDGQCSSACVIAWAAGAHKQMQAGAHIGVHQAALGRAAAPGEDGPSVERYSTAIMARWLRANGAPGIVVAQTISTPPTKLYWLTDADLAAWKVER